jgi:hypothetical protein
VLGRTLLVYRRRAKEPTIQLPTRKGPDAKRP